MLHKMKLNESPFERIKNGTKTIEFRLYDEKRKQIKIGDKIEFSKLPDLQEKLVVDVLDLYQGETFKELFEKLYDEEERDEIERKTKSMYTIYSPEKEAEYGVLGIKIKINNYMKIADDLAKENLKTNNGGPFGACIVKNGKIIGKGSNHVLANNDPTAHAEIMAIREASKNINSYDLSECELYTTCYPCPMCLSAIIWSNIKTVYYGNTKKDAADIGFRDDFIYNFIHDLAENKENNEILKLSSMDRCETIKTFEEFKNKADKTIY